MPACLAIGLSLESTCSVLLCMATMRGGWSRRIVTPIGLFVELFGKDVRKRALGMLAQRRLS